MNTTTATYTPWGWTQDIEELAEGVWRVTTPSHGGLKLSRERWDELPTAVRDTMLTPTFAEEDCEEPIVRTLMGLGDDRDREMALTVAGYFDRYGAALAFIRNCPPGNHHHAVSYRNGHRSDPFGRFDTRVEAESFTGDPEMVGKYGPMEAIDCTGTLPTCMGKGEGGWAMTTRTRARPGTLPSTTTRLQTEMGNLFITVSVDEDGEPFEVFGALGKGGSFQHGVTELACRLISLHLRRGTPLAEIIDQIGGISEMQPFFNKLGDGRSVAVRGLGDGIAHILNIHLKAGEERQAAKEEADAAEAKQAA